MVPSSGFFFLGRLRVPTRRCDLVVPADGGWGRSNEVLHNTILVKLKLWELVIVFNKTFWSANLCLRYASAKGGNS